MLYDSNVYYMICNNIISICKGIQYDLNVHILYNNICDNIISICKGIYKNGI